MSHGKRILLGVILIAIIFIGFGVWNNLQPGEYDAFVQCLGEKGAKFYGAFWCPHCQEQKQLFGRSKNKLPYTECSAPNGREQLPVCTEKGIKGYPTWIFKDGEARSSVQSPEALAEKTGCEMPL